MSWFSSMFAFREKHEGDVEKPFLDHLEDLRWTLIKMVSVLIVGMIVSFCFDKQLLHLLQGPLQAVEPGTKLNTTIIVEAFTISLTVAFYGGIVLTFPFQLYFVAGFVLPALTRQEKRLLFPSIAGGFLLFAGGVVVGFRWLLPKTLHWFHQYATDRDFITLWTAKSYYSFVTHLCLACGLLCELPVVMVALSVMGVLSYGFLKSTRRYGVAIILIVVAIIAPTPDPITFFTLAVPMLAIFEGSIWLVWLIEARRRKNELSGQSLGD